jgi:two-component system, OmpR family, response regulator
MPRGLVLVIEDDEWVSRLLASAIRGADYEVVVCGTAKNGLESACSIQPDCIICDVDLPDSDGYWVAQNVRTQPSRVSVTPFLFLSGLDDQESRLAGFHVGADVYMTKPFRVDEVVAQVAALVQMASRLRQRRDSLISIPAAPNASAIEGDLSQMSIATVLTILEMERRTGIFEVVSKKRRATLEIVSGYIMHGVVGGTKVSALAAMRTMLGWNVGRFSFTPTAPRDAPPSQKSIGAFLIEAMRLEDESARVELDLPPAKKRQHSEPKLPAPALGGPPSSPDDLAPASSRAPRPSEPPREIDVVPVKEPPPPAKPPPPLRTALRLPPPPPPRTAAHPPPILPPPAMQLKPAPIPAAPPRPGAAPPLAPPRPPRPDPDDKKR